MHNTILYPFIANSPFFANGIIVHRTMRNRRDILSLPLLGDFAMA